MRVVISLLLVMLCISCTDKGYTNVTDFPDQTWHEEQSAVFDFQVDGGEKPQKINVLLRYRSIIEGKEIKLIVKTSDAKRLFWIDTLDVTLRGDNGHGILSQMIPYRESVIWESDDKHTISIGTDRDIGNIVSIGVEIR